MNRIRHNKIVNNPCPHILFIERTIVAHAAPSDVFLRREKSYYFFIDFPNLHIMMITMDLYALIDTHMHRLHRKHRF